MSIPDLARLSNPFGLALGWLLRRRIERQLLVLLVGALDGDVAQQQRGREYGVGHVAQVVGYPQVFAGGLDTGAQGALVEIVQSGAAHQFALAVEADAVEQPWR